MPISSQRLFLICWQHANNIILARVPQCWHSILLGKSMFASGKRKLLSVLSGIYPFDGCVTVRWSTVETMHKADVGQSTATVEWIPWIPFILKDDMYVWGVQFLPRRSCFNSRLLSFFCTVDRIEKYKLKFTFPWKLYKNEIFCLATSNFKPLPHPVVSPIFFQTQPACAGCTAQPTWLHQP